MAPFKIYIWNNHVIFSLELQEAGCVVILRNSTFNIGEQALIVQGLYCFLILIQAEYHKSYSLEAVISLTTVKKYWDRHRALIRSKLEHILRVPAPSRHGAWRNPIASASLHLITHPFVLFGELLHQH